MIAREHFSDDTLEFLRLLHKNSVKYLIIGGEAVIYYGYARLTGDIDIFYERTSENIERLYSALLKFWGGDIPGLTNKQELFDKNAVFQFGAPPNRLDLLNDIEGITFEEAWKYKIIESVRADNESIRIYFIGLNQLIENKQKVARPKDIEDLKYLKALKEREKRISPKDNA